MKNFFVSTLICLAAVAAFAEGTRTWTQNSYDDFEKGTSKGIAIRSDGTLYLAPSFRLLSTTPSTYVWKIAADAQGNAYVATGGPARVYRVTPDGKSSVIFEPQELQVQSLVVDPAGTVYAATSPDGKVYRIARNAAPKAAKNPTPSATEAEPGYTVAVFFDPNTKYIWDMALDGQGRLYVATGDKGEIFRVEKNGQGSVFFKSDEAHIRALAVDSNGNLIAGSDGSGLIYRISPAGEGFVLYSANKKEITALAVDAKGDIYAAGVGEKRVAGQPGVPPALPPQPQPAAPAPATGNAPQGAAPSPAPAYLPRLASGGGSEVYRIAADGAPRQIWSSREDIAYALAFDARGQLVVGTGNKGHVFAVRDENEFSDLVTASATQVTAIAAAPQGALFVATSNLGKVFLLGAEPDAEGNFDSDVFDARIFSRWGRAELRGEGLIDLFARSGNVDNPDRNWSPWQKVDLQRNAELNVPAARFVQWRIALRPGARPAHVDSVTVNYRPNNVPPEVDDVNVQIGTRYIPRAQGENLSQPPASTKDRNFIGVRWNAGDDDDDQLVFSVYYRGDGESRWKLLKEGITDRAFSFDDAVLPDGGYTVRVVASDAPSHSPDEALTASAESSHFEIDNAPPVVENLAAIAEGDQVHVTFRAMDGFSPIKRAEYSVDAGPWQFVEPVGLLSDSVNENYDFTVALPAGTSASDADLAPAPAKSRKKSSAPVTEHTVVVRVYDRYDNMGSSKALVRTK